MKITPEYKYLKLHLAGLTAENVSEFYNRKLTEFLYYQSHNVEINGAEVEAGLKRFLYTLPDKEGNPNITSLKSGATKSGFNITEKMFVEKELHKLTSNFTNGNKFSFELDLTAKAEYYINFLKKRLAALQVEKGNPAPQNSTITIPDNILQKLEKEKLITSREPLQWHTKKIALCAYFVDCNFIKTNPNNLWATGEKLFNVRNLRQAKNNYLNNKSTGGKPKNYQIIDGILEQNR